MNITVYCGSNSGNDPRYISTAREVGEWIADNNHTLVYGAGRHGLMGEVAESVATKGGEIVGIIPEFLIGHEGVADGISEFHEVEDMSIRKKMLLERADVVIGLPGGPGTLEEITEAYSWAIIGQNDAPIILYNIDGFYEPLRQMFENMAEAEFVAADMLDYIFYINSIEEMEEIIENYQAPTFREF